MIIMQPMKLARVRDLHLSLMVEVISIGMTGEAVPTMLSVFVYFTIGHFLFYRGDDRIIKA